MSAWTMGRAAAVVAFVVLVVLFFGVVFCDLEQHAQAVLSLISMWCCGFCIGCFVAGGDNYGC